MKYVLRTLDIGIVYYFIAVVLAVILWVLLHNNKIQKRAALSVLLPYLFLVGASTIITRRADTEKHAILKPFWTIQAILTGGKQKAWLLNEVFLNILMLMPVGFLLPFLFEKRKLAVTLLIGMGISLTIEIVQLLTHRGYPEIDDLIFNMLGVFIGYGIYSIVKRRPNHAQQ